MGQNKIPQFRAVLQALANRLPEIVAFHRTAAVGSPTPFGRAQMTTRCGQAHHGLRTLFRQLRLKRSVIAACYSRPILSPARIPG